MPTIVIDKEFASLIPEAMPEEKESLEDSLRSEGCRDALCVWRNGKDILLDGHRRFEICQRLRLPFETKGIPVADRDAAKAWIIQNQFMRRNLTPFQRAELALKLEPLIVAKAKAAEKTHTKEGYQKSENPVHTGRELAQKAGISHDTIAKAKFIAEHASKKVKEKLRRGESNINKEFRRLVKKQTARAREKAIVKAQAEIASLKVAEVCIVRCCDFRELLKDCKADVIITDPPYPKEFLSLYGKLAMAAKEARIPLVAVMCGQSYLPQILGDMCKHLEYRWMMCYLTPGGQAVQQWERRINTFWKPIIIFGKAGSSWFGDVASSNANDKEFHRWGQSVDGMADVVKRLTAPPGKPYATRFVVAERPQLPAFCPGANSSAVTMTRTRSIQRFGEQTNA